MQINGDVNTLFQDEVYAEKYEKIFNQGLLAKLAGFTHFAMEHPLRKKYFQKILELGAGNGEHLPFVKSRYVEYIETDIRKSKRNPNLKILNAEDLTEYESGSFDRIIAMCLIAHLNKHHEALKEWRRVVKKGGVITFYIPCEPGLLLRAFRFLSTNLKSKKIGYDHYRFHYLEHRNYYINLKYEIREVFKNDQISIRKYPFGVLPWNLNLFAICSIEVSHE